MTAPDYHHREDVAAPRERAPVENPGELVRSDRGQFALSWLAGQEGVASLDTWADHLAAREEEEPLYELSERRKRHYYCWLYFALIPRLEQEGLVERHDDVVRAQVDADRLEAYPA